MKETTENRNSLYRDLSVRLSRAFFVLLVGGGIIGFLHHEDMIVAGILAVATVFILWSTYKRKPSMQRGIILITGTLLTGLFGVQVELWGINNGYWAYHDLSDGRHFARWLPFAWMLAFIFLYRVEEYFIYRLNLTSLKNKLILAAIISAILPTWGEIVAINLGVWTYYWGYQFFGVPLLAILLLMIFHTGIFIAFTVVCRKLQIEDTVFGIRNGQNQPDKEFCLDEPAG